MLIDTHTHLNDKRYVDDIDDIIKKLDENAISKVICVGYNRESSEKACELAQDYDVVYGAIGIHPHDSKNAKEEDFLLFEQLSKKEKIVAYGEIGLDFYYNFSDKQIQEEVFVKQLYLANKLELPVILHVRDAFQKTFDILKANRDLLAKSGVMHCYSGSAEMVRQFVDLGLYISFSGVITFKNSKKKDVVLATPLDRLLIETDCPYLTPEPHRGKMNYPHYVKYVAQQMQSWLPNEDVSKITTDNAHALFEKLR